MADDRRATKQIIRELVENWAVWRDARLWDRFRTVWHADGRMLATWFQGSFEEFIKANEDGWKRGVRILHFLGGSAIDIAGTPRRRADQDDDLAARARRRRDLRRGLHRRFYDFFEKRDGRWGLCCGGWSMRKTGSIRSIPSAKLALDQDLLKHFPEGYRHLAYLQTKIGYKVKTDMAGLEGPDLDALYAQGARWLKGEAL